MSDTVSSGSNDQTNVSRSVERAKFAEQTERYDDMSKAMKSVVQVKKDLLDIEERNLLSVAYKNVVGARRSSYRVISALEEKSSSSGDTEKKERAVEYRKVIVQELRSICDDVLVGTKFVFISVTPLSNVKVIPCHSMFILLSWPNLVRF